MTESVILKGSLHQFVLATNMVELTGPPWVPHKHIVVMILPTLIVGVACTITTTVLMMVAGCF